MIAALGLLRGLPWKWIGAALVVVGIFVWLGRFEDKAYKAGERAERARWEARAAKEAERIRLAYDTAAKIAAEAKARRDETFRPIEQEAKDYASKPEARERCVDAAGVGVMQRAIDAANQAAAPAS